VIWIPSIELIEEIFKNQIGIDPQYTHREYLETALDLMKWGHPMKNSEMSIWEQTAILMRNIVQFHVFTDGNKRIGIHITYVFLRKNGYMLDPKDPEEIFRFPMDIAQGKLSLDEIAHWYHQHAKKES